MPGFAEIVRWLCPSSHRYDFFCWITCESDEFMRVRMARILMSNAWGISACSVTKNINGMNRIKMAAYKLKSLPYQDRWRKHIQNKHGIGLKGIRYQFQCRPKRPVTNVTYNRKVLLYFEIQIMPHQHNELIGGSSPLPVATLKKTSSLIKIQRIGKDLQRRVLG